MRVINDPEKYKSFADALGDGRVPDGVVLFSHGDSDLLQFVSKKGLVPATWWQCSIPINSFFGYCCNSANILSQNSYDYIVKDWIGYTDEIWLKLLP